MEPASNQNSDSRSDNFPLPRFWHRAEETLAAENHPKARALSKVGH